MAAVTKKLKALLCAAAAAAKQGSSPTFSGTQYSPLPAPRSFFCSWLEPTVAVERPLPNHSPFRYREASVNSHLFAHYLAPASLTLASSLDSSTLPSSFAPHGASILNYLNLHPASLGRILYINDVKSPEQTNLDESSSTYENVSTHPHLHASEKKEAALKHRSPWASDEVINWPNAISFGRLLSGPFLAWLISEGLLQSAVIGLVIAGASDWLDGHVARRRGIDSVFGTYLDPLADKVLIGCVALSMAHAGYIPTALVALVIARDAALIGGSFILRAHSMKWQVGSLQEFFNVMNGGVVKVEPLYISKINTVFQLALVGVALLQPAFGIEDVYSLVPLLSWCVAFTTCASSVGYGWKLLYKSH